MSIQKEVKYAHRYPPCPDYDIEGVESWLTDLAKEGLLLNKDTPFLGFYSFIRTTPQAVRYRLEPAGKTQSFWDGEPGKPKEEDIDIHADLGWEYVTRYGDFYIYRSFDPNVRDLHTDPDIQAMSLNILKKRQRSTIFSQFFVILIYLLFGFLRYPMGMAVGLGTPVMVCIYAFFLTTLIRPAISLFKLRKIQQRILNAQPMNRKKEWKSNAWRNRILKLIPEALAVLMLFGSCSAMIAEDANEIKLEDYPADPPFVTIADLFPEGAYNRKDFGSYTNTVREWSDWLFPTNITWDEMANIITPDGTTLSGSIDIDYHEAVSPMLANQLARELMYYCARDNLFDTAPEIEPEQIGSVTVYRFTDRTHFHTAILTSGNTVVQAQFIVDNSEENIIETTWIQQMAHRLTNLNKEA